VSAVRRWTALLSAGTAAVVTACGQKGPLTLPDKSAAVLTTPASAPAAAPTTAPADKSKEKDGNSRPPE
jgi:predicted small lipoprotein YifL